jgi:hypothetical protein
MIRIGIDTYDILNLASLDRDFDRLPWIKRIARPENLDAIAPE